MCIGGEGDGKKGGGSLAGKDVSSEGPLSISISSSSSVATRSFLLRFRVLATGEGEGGVSWGCGGVVGGLVGAVDTGA